ncbi:MAG: hypothetical protein JJT90_08060 [Ectothiorhodospiraceae bacterium]|nr:hypothetical protein [Ectothiorhodospiraceae bacterium]
MKHRPESRHHTNGALSQGVFRELAQALRAMRERYRLLRDLERLDAGERQRLLQDARVNRGELPGFHAQGPDQLLPRMMARFGLDTATLEHQNGAVLRDIQRVCAACPSQRRCRKALMAGAPLEECRVLCPNAGTFEALTGADAHASSPTPTPRGT